MAMSVNEAVALVREQVMATVEVVHAVNSGRGRVSKAKDARERRAAKALLYAMTGQKPTDEQVTAAIGGEL
jgi:hypothetical protein